jgi:hypothetical protein
MHLPVLLLQLLLLVVADVAPGVIHVEAIHY